MPKNLVVPRVGANSLHRGWLDPNLPRTWDLYLCPYQPVPDELPSGCEVGEVIVGPKWSGLRDLLRDWDGWREYDYIWFPDDDIAVDQERVNRLFEIAAGLGLDLFAPALDEGSYYAHFDTMRNRSFFARSVGFVEIMIPGLSRAALEKVLPTLDESETGWGWGLDSVWPKLLGYENIGIIDAVTVSHTRPVGVMRDEELRGRVHEESDKLLESYDCRQEHVTFGAFGEDMRPLDLEPAELLSRLVTGWNYLIEADPRVLVWIADFQSQHHGRIPYPTAGTPEAR